MIHTLAQLNKKPAVVVPQPDPALNLTLQYDTARVLGEARTGDIKSHSILGGLHHKYVRI
jgi:hypothetical protein